MKWVGTDFQDRSMPSVLKNTHLRDYFIAHVVYALCPRRMRQERLKLNLRLCLSRSLPWEKMTLVERNTGKPVAVRPLEGKTGDKRCKEEEQRFHCATMGGRWNVSGLPNSSRVDRRILSLLGLSRIYRHIICRNMERAINVWQQSSSQTQRWETLRTNDMSRGFSTSSSRTYSSPVPTRKGESLHPETRERATKTIRWKNQISSGKVGIGKSTGRRGHLHLQQIGGSQENGWHEPQPEEWQDQQWWEELRSIYFVDPGDGEYKASQTQKNGSSDGGGYALQDENEEALWGTAGNCYRETAESSKKDKACMHRGSSRGSAWNPLYTEVMKITSRKKGSIR